MVRFGPFLVLRFRCVAAAIRNSSILLALCVNQLVGFSEDFLFTQDHILLAWVSILVVESQPCIVLTVIKLLLIYQQVPVFLSHPLGQRLFRRATGAIIHLVFQEHSAGKLPGDGVPREQDVERIAV